MNALTNRWLKGLRIALVALWYLLLVLVDLNSYGLGKPTYLSQIGSVASLYIIVPIVIWYVTLMLETLIVAVCERARKSMQ
jgi:hypothetical protein